MVQASPASYGVPRAGGAYRIRTGVPIGMRRASRLIGPLAIRMQPWEGRPGIRYGWFVPWMPTTPPPGQSLRLE